MKKVISYFNIFLLMIIINNSFILNAQAASSNIKLNNTSAVLAITETLQLSVEGAEEIVKWFVSDNEVASVSSSGKVTAKAVGEITVTAKIGDEKLTCLIKVQKHRIAPSKKEITVNVKLTLKVLGDIKGKTLKWSSSDSEIAVINKNGVITVKKQGKVKISVSIDGIKYTRIFSVVNLEEAENANANTPTSVTPPVIVVTDPSVTNSNEQAGDKVMPTVNIQVGNANFKMILYDNVSAWALLAQMPLTINMSELNGNEKYYYLPEILPTDSVQAENIKSGDLMLYGSDCLVLFYKSFSTSYSYTKLGYIEDVSGLLNALGIGNVKVTFNMVI